MSGLQKMPALFGSWERASLKTARNAVTQPSYDGIAKIADWAWDEFEERSDEKPRPTQLPQQRDDRIGTAEDAFLRAACRFHGRFHDQDGVGSEGADSVAVEQCGYHGRFRGSEAQPVAPVTSQEPANGAIAEAAMAVVYDQQSVIEPRKISILGSFGHGFYASSHAMAASLHGIQLRRRFYT